MKIYSSSVSRVLAPENRGLTTVVGQYDKPISDADVNLIQDLQDWKRQQITDRLAPSGCLTRAPFSFYLNSPSGLFIPPFEVLFRGEVVNVRGHLYNSQGINKVAIPFPASGIAPAALYAVFIELWYAALDPTDGTNYIVDVNGNRFYYPYGCVAPYSNARAQFPDDTIDPVFNEVTSQRVQLQWRLGIQPLPLDYDFLGLRYGLDPDPIAGGQIYGQGTQSSPTDQVFKQLRDVTGEATLWRSGGDALNSLQTLDGYSYAMPLAVLFQRTLNIFDPESAPFGCADTSGGGYYSSKISGRWDGRFADITYPEDVIDTRITANLSGYDLGTLLTHGMGDLLSGACRAKIARGTTPQNMVGSVLTQQAAMTSDPSSAMWQNTDVIGAFDGFRNGISTDERTYFTSVAFDAPTGGWGGKQATVSLPASTPAGATITSVFVQSINLNNTPMALMGRQLIMTGVGTRSVVVTVGTGLPFNPSSPANRLIVTVGVTYPAKSAFDLQVVPLTPVFGSLNDPRAGAGTGMTLPVFGVSDYDISVQIPPINANLTKSIEAYSPRYSSSVFGVRAHILIPNSQAVLGAGNTATFTIPRTSLDGRLAGLYVTRALNAAGQDLTVVSRGIQGDDAIVVVQGPLLATGNTEMVLLCHRTAQVAINPAVRGAVAIEETVLLGAGTLTAQDLMQDARLLAVSAVQQSNLTTTIITGTVAGGRLRGIAGDDSGDQSGLIWVSQGSGDSFLAIPCTITVSVSAFTITVPNAKITLTTPWFIPASFLPGLDPSAELLLSMPYVPYQGEGIQGRDYLVLDAAAEALITTNGTGTAPTPGMQDVFPYNRQLPVATMMPSRSNWNDSDLTNAPIGGDETNYSSKRKSNTAATFPATLRLNDFVPPLQGSVQRKIRVLTPTSRGFSRTLPHVGFAVDVPVKKTGLGLSFSTVAPLTLYVDNVGGQASNTGLSSESPLPAIKDALALLPPIIRHPVSILLMGNPGAPYALGGYSIDEFVKSSVDGGVYCLGEVAHTMQGAGSLTFGPTLTDLGSAPVIIDGSGVITPGEYPASAPHVNFSSWVGDAPFTGIVVSNGRVAFESITFQAPPVPYTIPLHGTSVPPALWNSLGAVRSVNAEVSFNNCTLQHPMLGVTADLGSKVEWTGGLMVLDVSEVGVLASESTVIVDNPSFTLDVTSQGMLHAATFFAVNNSSSLTLRNHRVAQELGFPLPGSPDLSPVISLAEMSSSITAEPTWATMGIAVLNGKSVINLQADSQGAQAAFKDQPTCDPSSSSVSFLG